MSHVSNGACPGCLAKAALYFVDPGLLAWFVSFQKKHPEAHASCFGRGKAEQEADFVKKVTRAHWLQSPHNYGLAVDFFRIGPDGKADFSPWWYRSILGPEAQAAGLTWGGTFKSLTDLPHVETRDWEAMVKLGRAKAVE